MKEIDRLDKLERDTRRFYYPAKGNKIPNNPSKDDDDDSKKLVGKPIADMAVNNGDILIYNTRNKEWEVNPIQPHIIDANGTLADITTKFNTLLAELETRKILVDL